MNNSSDFVTVRPAVSSDMDSIFMMGFDVWNDGCSKEQYLESCRASEKYALGEWYCHLNGGVLVSSLIMYEHGFGLADRYGGIGSVATVPGYRSQGYASALIRKSIDIFADQQYLGVFLFSEVDSEFYEKFGFSVVRREPGSAMMFLSLNGGGLTDYPSYF